MQLYASGPGLPKFLAARVLSKFAASLGKAIWRLKQILMHLMHSIPQLQCTMMQLDILKSQRVCGFQLRFNKLESTKVSPQPHWLVMCPSSSIIGQPSAGNNHLHPSSPSIISIYPSVSPNLTKRSSSSIFHCHV